MNSQTLTLSASKDGGRYSINHLTRSFSRQLDELPMPIDLVKMIEIVRKLSLSLLEDTFFDKDSRAGRLFLDKVDRYMLLGFVISKILPDFLIYAESHIDVKTFPSSINRFMYLKKEFEDSFLNFFDIFVEGIAKSDREEEVKLFLSMQVLEMKLSDGKIEDRLEALKEKLRRGIGTATLSLSAISRAIPQVFHREHGDEQLSPETFAEIYESSYQLIKNLVKFHINELVDFQNDLFKSPEKLEKNLQIQKNDNRFSIFTVDELELWKSVYSGISIRLGCPAEFDGMVRLMFKEYKKYIVQIYELESDEYK